MDARAGKRASGRDQGLRAQMTFEQACTGLDVAGMVLALEQQQAGAGAAECARDSEQVARARAVAAREVLLRIGVTDDRHDHEQLIGPGDVTAGDRHVAGCSQRVRSLRQLEHLALAEMAGNSERDVGLAG